MTRRPVPKVPHCISEAGLLAEMLAQADQPSASGVASSGTTQPAMDDVELELAKLMTEQERQWEDDAHKKAADKKMPVVPAVSKASGPTSAGPSGSGNGIQKDAFNALFNQPKATTPASSAPTKDPVSTTSTPTAKRSSDPKAKPKPGRSAKQQPGRRERERER